MNVVDNSEIHQEDNAKIRLSEDQDKIYNNLINFLKDDKLREILLIGYAGTGKTTLVTKFIIDIIKKKICRKIVIAAPTHKAVNIAKSKLFDNLDENEILSKNINIMTVHRLLNYKSNIDMNGNKYFAKNGVDANWNIYQLIIVDECSMLSNQIIHDIKSQLEMPNSKVKIIYVGDPAQLPPVNQYSSEIFERKIKTLKLEKIIRTKNQEIMNLSNDHRKWIMSQLDNDIPEICKYQCKNIKIYSSEHNQTELWLNKFIKMSNINNINNNSNNNIILTWTNKKCNSYNKYIREKIFNKKDLDHFEIGEILIFNDFYRIQKPNDLDIEKIEFYSFYTSEQVKLIENNCIKYKFQKIIHKNNNKLPIEINKKFQKTINNLNNILDIEIDIYDMKIKKINEIINNNELATIYNIFSIYPNSTIKYNKILDDFENHIALLQNKCYTFINNIPKINNNIKSTYQGELEKKFNKLYISWQETVIDKFAQLNYGYSITVHKSQGSTFSNVFIDILDILNNNNNQETSKCLYTAITRSSNTLQLLI